MNIKKINNIWINVQQKILNLTECFYEYNQIDDKTYLLHLENIEQKSMNLKNDCLAYFYAGQLDVLIKIYSEVLNQQLNDSIKTFLKNIKIEDD